jgi:hypothetical protein
MQFFATRVFEASRDDVPPTMTVLIKQFHEEHATIGMARTTLRGFHMPSIKMMQHLRRKFKVQGKCEKELDILEKNVRPVNEAYLDLFNSPEKFPTLHRQRDLEFALDVMEAFVR